MLLAIYLNDHLAAGTAGRELARRARGANQGTSYGEFLDGVAEAIDEDRSSLLEIMSALGVRVDPLKVAAGWGAEKVGRLKPNGRLLGYSPLSRVIELEGLLVGARGQLALWHTLNRLGPTESALADFDLQRLISRSEGRIEQLEEHRLRAVSDAFA
jgi:hypothetical protein